MRIIYKQHEKKIRYLIVGGGNTFLGFSAYPILYLLLPQLRAHYIWLLVICHIICITVAYFTNKYLVFKMPGSILWQYIKFTIFYNIIFAINLLVLPLLVEYRKFNPVAVQIIINFFIVIGSYFWHKHVTFSIRKQG